MPEPGPSESLEDELEEARWLGKKIQRFPDDGQLAALIAWTCDDLDQMTAFASAASERFTEFRRTHDEQSTSEQDQP